MLAFGQQRAEAGGAEGLVRGYAVEIRTERVEVHRQVSDRLGTVDQYWNAGCVCDFDQVLDRIDGAERIGHVHHRHHAGFRPELGAPVVEIQASVIQHIGGNDAGASGGGYELPRHNVAVVLHTGEQDFVARPQTRLQKAAGHQIDGLGGAARKHELLARGAEEGGDAVACAFVLAGGTRGQFVDGAVHVAVAGSVVAVHRPQYGFGLLRGGAVVEIGKTLAVDHFRQNRELRADRRQVQAMIGLS